MIKSSYADFVQDWKSLLGAAVENAADLPEAERHRLALQQKVEAVETEKLAQLSAQAAARLKTQTLRRLVDEAEELAKRLRGVAVAGVGPRSERLSQFGVAPLRKRRRRSRKPEEAPAPKEGPETATPAPAGPPGPESTTDN